jgi:hypothetical protein
MNQRFFKRTPFKKTPAFQMLLSRDVLVLSPSGWQFWQINAMSFDWRKSALLIPNKETEQIMIH